MGCAMIAAMPRCLSSAIVMLACSCAGASFNHWRFEKSEVTYRTGALPSDWQRFSIDDGDLAFRNGKSGGTIFANALCGDHEIEDTPLDVLANNLLMGIKPAVEQSRETLTLAGRQALRVHVLGELDGVIVAMDLVVLKKNNCTMDLQLVAGKNEIAASEDAFTGFVNGFVLEKP